MWSIPPRFRRKSWLWNEPLGRQPGEDGWAMDHLLFLGVENHPRTTTILMMVAFAVVGLAKRRPLRGFAACWAYLYGFEVAWQTGNYLTGQFSSDRDWMITTTATVLVALALARPDWRLTLVALGLWTIWLLSGFHSNAHTMRALDWPAEFLNESCKVAWGLALLLPILRQPARRWQLLRVTRSAVAASMRT